MPRVKAVQKPGDYPGPLDDTAKNDVAALFARLCPGQAAPALTGGQLGWGVMAAHSPRLALLVAELTFYIAREMAWCQRRDLRELAIQTVNFHFRSGFSFQSHWAQALAAGLSAEQIAAIPYWRTTTLFDDEQRLVIEYALAVAAADVPDTLFARVIARYGEKGTIEFTTVVAHWSFWGMIGNALQPGGVT